MDLRAMFKRDFDVDLPISGGSGNSPDNPVFIERTSINNFVTTEHKFLELLGKGRGIVWKLLQQSVLEHNGRILDKIKIETQWIENEEMITQIENFYFDITDCYNSKPENKINPFEGLEPLPEIEPYTNPLNLVESIFNSVNEYRNFLLLSSEIAVANEEATCMALLQKENNYLQYTLTWLNDGKFVSERIKLFEPTDKNLKDFNWGCKTMAFLLDAYIESDNPDLMPADEIDPFGELTYKG